jgi:hypothetical protein
MQGELTYYCQRFYEMDNHFIKHDERFYHLVKKALPYTKQTNATELDAIMQSNRKVQKAYGTVQDIIKEKNEAEKAILQIMEYFEVPKETKLTCILPGEAELEIWADEDNRVQCIKTKSLAPLVADPNLIVIRLVADQFALDDDEENENGDNVYTNSAFANHYTQDDEDED